MNSYTYTIVGNDYKKLLVEIEDSVIIDRDKIRSLEGIGSDQIKINVDPDLTVDEEVELTTNLILKKLRIALMLKEAQTEIIFSLGESELTKQQLSSLFRKEGHKNFKPCSQELLMAFLDGLDEFYFVGNSEE